MGCNGWNHPSWCNCGWGGDTGGGGRSVVSYKAPLSNQADGLIWRSDRHPSYESYTIPNATCPVCGATVFFYQSPFGGRVFFDSLGPPWPKHLCTDTYFRPGRIVQIEGSATPSFGNRKSAAWEKDGWTPLCEVKVVEKDGCTFLEGLIWRPVRYHSFGVRGSYSINTDSPVFCRKLKDNSGRYEISFIPNVASYDQLSSVIVVMFQASRNEAHLARWESAQAGSAEDQNLLGMSLSFHLDTDRLRELDFFPAKCDWEAAEHWFRLAAMSGFWAAVNNLGVMYQHGYGVEQDDDLAFAHFSEAAQSLSPTSLRHLADCYGEGIGIEQDRNMAEYLRELAHVCEGDVNEID